MIRCFVLILRFVHAWNSELQQCPFSIDHKNNSFVDPHQDFEYNCISGHWPLSRSCHTIGIGLSVDVTHSSVQLITHKPLENSVKVAWRILDETHLSPKCSVIVHNVLLLPIPYDRKAYQSDGSNYYVIHIDTVIPLWNLLRSRKSKFFRERNNAPPTILLFPFDINGSRNNSTNDRSFGESNKYWIKSIQIMFDNSYILPASLSSLVPLSISYSAPSYVHSQSTVPNKPYRICLADARLGTPLYDRPTSAAVREYSMSYRQVITRPPPPLRPPITFPLLALF
jgi:hypothetical protein